MATNYPGSIDSLPRPTSTTTMDEAGYEGDVVIDNISDAVEAIETELGTDPAGAQATVAARLAYSLRVDPSMLTSVLVWESADYTSNQWGFNTSVSLACYADTMNYQPVCFPVSATLDRIGFYVNTSATVTCRVGLYSANSAGQPGSLIATLGTWDGSSTGYKELTISQSVTGGVVYWVATQTSADGMSLKATQPRVAVKSGSSTGTPGSWGYAGSNAYSGGLPSTATLDFEQDNPTIPVLWLRRT